MSDVKYAPNTSDFPVLIENLGVDVLALRRVLEERLNDELAEINLQDSVSINFNLIGSRYIPPAQWLRQNSQGRFLVVSG